MLGAGLAVCLALPTWAQSAPAAAQNTAAQAASPLSASAPIASAQDAPAPKIVHAPGRGAPAQAAPAGNSDLSNSYEVVVGAGKSQVLQLPTPYSDLMIADPKVADVMPLTSRSVYVVGKTMGATALTVYGPGRRLIAAVNVVVSADVESFKSRLHEILPDERDVAARAANDAIVLSGTATSPAVLQQIVTLAETYAPGKIVNMMTVEGAQQVTLSVRFVEMERSAAKDLNMGLSVANGHGTFNFQSGSPILPLSNPYGILDATFQIGHTDLTLTIDALENRGLVKTLAEPNLTTMSGETANFLAGGEFPIPVIQGSAAIGSVAPITIEFKQFGIGLAFTPTILKDGLINMVVSPEVSSIDPTTSVVISGVTVPGLKIRRAHTTVELRDGESFTIAGLLSNNYQNTISQLPWVGDIPILGALFHSNAFVRDETELVIVVTPHLVVPRRAYAASPIDHFVPPSDLELFLLGQQRGDAKNVKPEDRVLMSNDPSTGGIDGPHGHVLY
jgi:pilus assembly protein CpaC